MLKEFKDFLKIQNLLLENPNLILSESTEIASIIIDVLKNNNLTIPEEIPNVDKINLENDKLLTLYTSDGKKQDIKIGKFLRQLYPDIKDNKLSKIVDDIKIKYIQNNKDKINLNNFEFIIDNNVVKWYEYFEKQQILKSCMTKKRITSSNVLDLYKMDDNIKILIVKENGHLVARALLWYNTSVGKCIDRVFSSNKYYEQITLLWAEKNGYKNVYESDIKAEYQIPKEIWEKLKYLPYLDSFYYVNKNGVLYSYQVANTFKVQNSLEGFDIDLYKSEWLKYFESIREIEQWSDYFNSPKDAYNWSEYFNDPEEASLWAKYFYYPKDAFSWQKNFSSVKEASDWANYFDDPEEAYNWSEYFYSSKKAQEYVERFDNFENFHNWLSYFEDNPGIAYDWANYFDDPDEASLWAKYFYYPKDAFSWQEYFSSVEEASDWANYFDDPDEASLWAKYFYYPKDAFSWQEYFSSVEEASDWANYFDDPEEAYNWSIYFFKNPKEALKWSKYFNNSEKAYELSKKYNKPEDAYNSIQEDK